MRPIWLRTLRAAHAMTDVVDHLYQAYDVLRSELMVAAVPPEHRQQLTNLNNAHNRLFRSAQHNQRSFAWERAALEQHFPPPPARVLVGGAGGGREVAALLDRGYSVVAFDPAPDLVAYARQQIGSPLLVDYECGSYQDLVSGRLGVERHAPFDAIWLGWGSLSHVARASDRLELMRRLRGLGAQAPVLLSWVRAKPDGAARERLRALLGTLGLRRGEAGDSFRAHMGFVHSIDDRELAALAAAGGYAIAHRGSEDPYAVLCPHASPP